MVWAILCLHRATGPLPRMRRSAGQIQEGSAQDNQDLAEKGPVILQFHLEPDI